MTEGRRKERGRKEKEGNERKINRGYLKQSCLSGSY